MIGRGHFDGSAGMRSMRTVDQSAPSSSATIIGSDVMTPCPNSTWSAKMVTLPSVPILR
jgi:hypothetical protein